MGKFSLQVTYENSRPLVAYLYFGDSMEDRSSRTEFVDEEFVVDYRADGTPLGVEILYPEEVDMPALTRLLKRLGAGRVTSRQLGPLVAA